MSASDSQITPGDIILTPCRVKFGGRDLGATEGGVSIQPKYDMANIMVDQYGKTVIDAVVSGQHYNCKFILSEVKNLQNWKVAFPHAKIVGGGEGVLFDMNIGDKVSNHAQLLNLHPLSNVDADLTFDFNAYLAVATSVSEIKFGPEKQIGLSVEMLVLPNTAFSPARFVFLGDPATGIVPAIAAAAVPGGSNVGNATITGPAANVNTKTEVITIACIGLAAGGDSAIAVSGSISGSLGTFTLGHTATTSHGFTAAPIAFTIVQGTTALAVGDTFTIATTAPNYA